MGHLYRFLITFGGGYLCVLLVNRFGRLPIFSILFVWFLWAFVKSKEGRRFWRVLKDVGGQMTGRIRKG